MDKRVFWDSNKACCFTGHRNKNLPFHGNREQYGMKCLVSTIQLYIEQAIKSGYNTFISGMANGIDLICAEIVFNLIARQNHDIKLVCAIPYKNQDNELKSPIEKYVYNLITQNSDVIYINEHHSKDCYQKRNQFMVDNSSMIIGVYSSSDKRSGTMQTINMAKKAKMKLQLINLDDNPIFYLTDK